MSDKLPALMPLAEVQVMAQAVAQSGLFGAKTPDQALALMLVAQAEGMHPMTAVQTYDIIEGKPAMKAQAMLARFQRAGGVVEWKARTNDRACASFTHPQGGTVEVEWTMEMAKASVAIGRSGLKDNWRKFPRAMLTARVVSEGVRTVYPAALGGFYTPEEVADFSPMRDVNQRRPSVSVTAPKPAVEIDPETGEVLPTVEEVRGILKPEPQENLATGKAQEPTLPGAYTGVEGVVAPGVGVPMPDPFPPLPERVETEAPYPFPQGSLRFDGWPPSGSSDEEEWKAAARKALVTARQLKHPDDVEKWQDENWRDGLATLRAVSNDTYDKLGEQLAKLHKKLGG